MPTHLISLSTSLNKTRHTHKKHITPNGCQHHHRLLPPSATATITIDRHQTPPQTSNPIPIPLKFVKNCN